MRGLPAGVALPGLLAVLLCSCAPAPEAAREAPAPPAKEELYREGHRLYQLGELDTAAALLHRAVGADSSYRPALEDLAGLHYELGIRSGAEGSKARLDQWQEAQRLYVRLDALGSDDAALYERLCELSVALRDTRSFLKYARKNAERYPYDRQFYNLGLAYYEAGDYQAVIRTQKEAIERFRQSQYIGAYYRQLGHAYMKVDRDQTAERTFSQGIQAVDARLAELRGSGGGGEGAGSPAARRLADDRINMLLALKRLHQIYHATGKLERVERLLREAGR